MSLDVYLTIDSSAGPQPERHRIFTRIDGRTVELSRAEWDELCPGVEPVTVREPASEEVSTQVFWANITHNLGTMARAAGLYDACWLAEENGVKRAGDLIEPLTLGLATLRLEKEQMLTLNPPNGWGDYTGFVDFIEDYLAACRSWPEAEVHCSR